VLLLLLLLPIALPAKLAASQVMLFFTGLLFWLLWLLLLLLLPWLLLMPLLLLPWGPCNAAHVPASYVTAAASCCVGSQQSNFGVSVKFAARWATSNSLLVRVGLLLLPMLSLLALLVRVLRAE
jgi:hypothetical protein